MLAVVRGAGFPFVAACALLASCGQQEAPPPPVELPSAEAVEAALADSVAGWNAGDLDRFMAVYSADPQTSFVTGEGLIRGRDTLADYYSEGFAFEDPEERGSLAIETLDFRALGTDHALLVGRYTLSWDDRDDASGVTSLVFRREDGGWKMIADHSS